jgi:hypothetical protein
VQFVNTIRKLLVENAAQLREPPETRFAGVTELRNLIHGSNPEQWPVSEKQPHHLGTGTDG